jgi:phosphohistidine phosphatase
MGLGDRLVEDDRLAPGFDVRRLEQLLAAHAPAGDVMVVGHEPDFSATVAELIGGGEIVMKKGGLARVDVTAPAAGGGELVWLLTPPLLGSR